MSDDRRLLGHRDGVASGLIAVRREIEEITAYPINTHHRRKIEARKAVLAPLYRIQGRLEIERNSTLKALDETRNKP